MSGQEKEIEEIKILLKTLIRYCEEECNKDDCNKCVIPRQIAKLRKKLEVREDE